MTYLEAYLTEHKCSEKDFWEDQEDYDGFCPPNVGVVDECAFDGTCEECWKREILAN